MKDLKLTMSDNQDLAQVAGTYYSNVLDLQTATDLKLGVGAPIFTHITVSEAFVGAGATVAFTVEHATDEIFTSPVTIHSVAATAITALTLGAVVMNKPFDGNFVSKRYMRVKYVIATATTTAGKVNAWLDDSPV